AALLHNALALGATATAATGRGEENPLLGKGLQQLVARRAGDGVLVVAYDFDVAGTHQPGPGADDDHHQPEHERAEHGNATDNFNIHSVRYSTSPVTGRYRRRT